MKKIFILFLSFFIFTSIVVDASPQVSFTSSSYNNRITLRPSLNSDVTHYKWTIEMKGGRYNSETGWIASDDINNHIVFIENGHYFVTIHGKNTQTNEKTSFTNKIVVSAEEDYIEPESETAEQPIISRLIRSIPEPIRTFLLERNSFELWLIVIGILSGIFLITRKEKKKKYVILERYKNEE